MAQRRHHYELAFEHYLRTRRIPYVAVNEARKALLPPDDAAPAPGSGAEPPHALKSFDFVLYGRGTNLLVEIKGRRIGPRPGRAATEDGTARGRAPGAGRLENWVTEEDVESLTAWERLFGAGFSAAFVFVYWCDGLPPGALFEEIFEFRGRWYALRAVTVAAYATAMRPRSRRWRTVHVGTAEFDRISTSLCAPIHSAGALHRADTPVASVPEGGDA